MTWRWRTYSKLGVAVAGLLAMRVGAAAALTGHIELAGSRESAVRKAKNFSGVVVWLQPSAEVAALPRQRAVMLQKDKTFLPHILAIAQGSSVEFPNLDPIFHSAFSNFEGQIFDIALYPPGTSRSVRFDRPGIVRVFCNIHPAMSAVIVVVNTRYFAITKEDGSFEISNVPPGEYGVHFFHERATPETLARLRRSISVTEQPVDLGPITISETGYLPVAHKNKYGQPYRTPGDEVRPYSN